MMADNSCVIKHLFDCFLMMLLVSFFIELN